MSDKVYNFTEIEKKWQNYWDDNKTFKATENMDIPKDKRFYCLDMFPYPSGAGLHVGHPEGYTATDIICRYRRMNGFNVLHPIGWDAFGLPAENYAIKTGTHPRVSTEKNISTFKRQIKSLGFSYDWDREISTCEPSYFKWTQWIFLKLFKAGLAYQTRMPINFCPSCKTGLSNEEVKDGLCERCSSKVERKDMNQWMLKITAYAERLLDDLKLLDWPESIKAMQKNWIGKSVGAEVDFQISDSDKNIRVFTTRPDTLFGATYMVLAPEHPFIDSIVTDEQSESVKNYIQQAKNKSDLERTDLAKEKTGVFTGGYAINPVNGEKIPIWISDYILISYGTGAIMAVPAHDERDFAFAKKYKLPIIQVVNNSDESSTNNEELEEAFVANGVAINSGQFNGLKTPEFKEAIIEWLVKEKKGEKAVHYKLRDWVFSRQRYWGEPIPLVHCEKCGIVPVPEEELPLKLPDVESYTPTGTGESPLAAIDDWVNTKCPKCNGDAKRETDTMPQWAGSCWYYLRYIDPTNDSTFSEKEKNDYWLPVDLYVGGAEHAVLHLLYSRFWHKFLFDQGLVSDPEPFKKLINQGLILGEDGQKMSKSIGNVINPDEVVEEFGSDAMRLYEMFMGPLEVSKPWNTRGILGVRRFLDKVWRLLEKPFVDENLSKDSENILHKTIKKVTDDIENVSLNTAISALMILTTELSKLEKLPREAFEKLIILLSPFAPHVSEELWERLGHKDGIAYVKWPVYDKNKALDSVHEIVFQVNGKVRDKLMLPVELSKEQMQEKALSSERVMKFTEGKDIVKVICVPGRLVNIVVK